jgi:UDP-N-acetylglucosamine 2-epimerase (non-hydrolysing)
MVTGAGVSGTAVVRVLYLVGARPNFITVAPVIAAAQAWNSRRDHGVHVE